MDSSAGSDSSGGRKRKCRELKFMVTPSTVKCKKDLSIVELNLVKPSGVNNAPDLRRQVCLEIVDPNDTFSLHILSQIHHKNILHLESTIKAEPSDKICVERYTQSLFSAFYDCPDMKSAQDLVRQLVEGIEELRLNHIYHGNLSIHTTYFDAPTNLVNLANFKRKGVDKDLTEAQYGDWHALGYLLREVPDILYFGYPGFNHLLLELACELETLSPHERDVRGGAGAATTVRGGARSRVFRGRRRER